MKDYQVITAILGQILRNPRKRWIRIKSTAFSSDIILRNGFANLYSQERYVDRIR